MEICPLRHYNWYAIASRVSLALTAEQIWACCYLEQVGLKFALDYGHEDAVAKANLWIRMYGVLN